MLSSSYYAMKEEIRNQLDTRNLLSRLFDRENWVKLVKIPEFYVFLFYWIFVVWILTWAGNRFNFDLGGFIFVTAILLFLFFTGFILTTSRKNNPANEKILVNICRVILWAAVFLEILNLLPLAYPKAVIIILKVVEMGLFPIIPLMSGVVTGSKVKIFD
jgi:hypothetical protein